MNIRLFFYFIPVILITLVAVSCITIKGWIIPEDVKLTTSGHNGDFGGYQQINAWIQANGCEEYHVCDYTEVSRWMQMNGQSVITENCWITSPGVYKEGTGNVGDCRGWRPIEHDVGTVMANSGGKVFPARHYCDQIFKVACCK